MVHAYHLSLVQADSQAVHEMIHGIQAPPVHRVQRIGTSNFRLRFVMSGAEKDKRDETIRLST